MDKYTFVIEYRKGTYIQQLLADDLTASINLWISQINQFDIPDLGTEEKAILEKEIINEKPTRIQGVDNVWCMFLKIKKTHLLVNIIKTV